MKQYKQYILGLCIISIASVVYLITVQSGQSQETDVLTPFGINSQIQTIKEDVMFKILSTVKSLFQKGF